MRWPGAHGGPVRSMLMFAMSAKFTEAPGVPEVTSRGGATSSARGTLFRRPQKLRPVHHLVLWYSLVGAAPALRRDDVGGKPKLACRPRRADVAGQPQELVCRKSRPD